MRSHGYRESLTVLFGREDCARGCEGRGPHAAVSRFQDASRWWLLHDGLDSVVHDRVVMCL